MDIKQLAALAALDKTPKKVVEPKRIVVTYLPGIEKTVILSSYHIASNVENRKGEFATQDPRQVIFAVANILGVEIEVKCAESGRDPGEAEES